MLKSVKELEQEKCFGCGACYNICPKHAIGMEDTLGEGFLYPSINEDSCVECGLCVRVCPAINRWNEGKTAEPQAYAIKSNKEIAEKCSSAGVFGVVAEYIYSRGGWICGAVFDKSFNVCHILTNEWDTIQKMKKSKYVQSNIGNIYVSIKEKLIANELVLFSGTPCQVAGLHTFLGQDYKNLITIDLLCHGVPSPGMWRKYLDQNYVVDQIENIDFRYRGSAGISGSQFLRVTYKDGRETVRDKTEDLFCQHFSKNIGLRKSCANCQYAVLPRAGDISIGDFWGAPQIVPDMADGDKISVVYVNSDKGKDIFNQVYRRFSVIKEISAEDALTKNRAGMKLRLHKNRSSFFKDVKNMNFNAAVKTNLNPDQYDAVITGPTFNFNYGATMTYYALYTFLKKSDYKTAVICGNKDLERKDFVAEFYKRNFCCIPTANNSKKNISWMADRVIVGSDQVWNYELFKNKGYFGSFFEEDIKLISYASSFGFDYLTLYKNSAEVYPEINKLMKRFSDVSVRERVGVDICRTEFEIDAEPVLDPVFILDEEDYNVLIANKSKEISYPFCVSYFLSSTEQSNNLLRYVSENLGLPIANMGAGNPERWIVQNEKTEGGCIPNVTVEDWLYYIKNSRFVVTNSFHCVCLSIIFRKNFLVMQKSWGLSRITSLLTALGLEDRLIESFDEINDKKYLLEREIDYDEVYVKLNELKRKSKSWLIDAMEAPSRISINRKSEQEKLNSADYNFKETQNIWEYLDLLKEHSNDYILASCTNGSVNDSAAQTIKRFCKEVMLGHNSTGLVEQINPNLLLNHPDGIKAKGNGKVNCRTLGIKFSDNGLIKLKETPHTVYSVSFDWTTDSASGKFKIQLGAAPWDSLTDYIDIDINNQHGHYENIYMSSDQIQKFMSDELQIRTDEVQGVLNIYNLKIEEGNRPTRSWINEMALHGFAMIMDTGSNYMNVSAASIGKIKYSFEDTGFLIEYSNGGYKSCKPITEVYIEADGKRNIYPCEGKGTYIYLYSKKDKKVIDIAFIKSDNNAMTIIHS